MRFQVLEVAKERVRALSVRDRLVVRVALDEVRIERKNGVGGEISRRESRRGVYIKGVERHGIVVVVWPGRRRNVLAQRAPKGNFLEQRAFGGMAHPIEARPSREGFRVLPIIFSFLVFGGMVQHFRQEDFRGVAGGDCEVSPLPALVVGVELVSAGDNV